jgi:hypothetical protein
MEEHTLKMFHNRVLRKEQPDVCLTELQGCRNYVMRNIMVCAARRLSLGGDMWNSARKQNYG